MKNNNTAKQKEDLGKLVNSLLLIDEKALTKLFDKNISSITKLSFTTIWQVGKELGKISWNKESKKEALARNIKNGLIGYFDQLENPNISSKITNAFFNSKLAKKREEIKELASQEANYFTQNSQEQAKRSLKELIENSGKAIKHLKNEQPALLNDLNNDLGDMLEGKDVKARVIDHSLNITKSLLNAKDGNSNIIFNFVSMVSEFSKSNLGFKIICNEFEKVQNKAIENKKDSSVAFIFSTDKIKREKQLGKLISGTSKIVSEFISNSQNAKKANNLIEKYQNYKIAKESDKANKFKEMLKSGIEIFSDPKIIQKTSKLLDDNKELTVAFLDQKLKERKAKLAEKAIQKNKTKLSFEEKILNKVDGEFCYTMLKNANTPKGLEAIGKAIENPSIMNQFYAAYKTNNLSLLITTTLSAITSPNKRKIEKLNTKNFKEKHQNDNKSINPIIKNSQRSSKTRSEIIKNSQRSSNTR